MQLETMLEYIDNRQVTVGNRLVLIGEADSVYKYYEQYFPLDMEDCRTMFGESPLTQAYWEAAKQGAGSIFCIPIKQLDRDNLMYALDTVDKYQYDILHIVNLYNTHHSLLELLDNYIASYCLYGNGLIAVLSAEPMFTSITNNYTTIVVSGCSSRAINNKPYYVFTAGNIVHNRYSKFEYQVSAASTFAGFLASIKPYINPMNKTINGIYIEHEFTEQEADVLEQAGFITFKNTINKGYVAASGVTYEAHEYFNIAHTRVINVINQTIANRCKKYIGNAINLLVIDDTVVEVMTEYLNAGYFRDYRHKVEQTARSEVTISLQVRPNDTVKIIKGLLKLVFLSR